MSENNTAQFLTDYSEKTYIESLAPSGVDQAIYFSLDDFQSSAISFFVNLASSASELTSTFSGNLFSKVLAAGGLFYDVVIHYNKEGITGGAVSLSTGIASTAASTFWLKKSVSVGLGLNSSLLISTTVATGVSYIVEKLRSSNNDYNTLMATLESTSKPINMQVHLANGEVLTLNADYVDGHLDRVLELIDRVQKSEKAIWGQKTTSVKIVTPEGYIYHASSKEFLKGKLGVEINNENIQNGKIKLEHSSDSVSESFIYKDNVDAILLKEGVLNLGLLKPSAALNYSILINQSANTLLRGAADQRGEDGGKVVIPRDEQRDDGAVDTQSHDKASGQAAPPPAPPRAPSYVIVTIDGKAIKISYKEYLRSKEFYDTYANPRIPNISASGTPLGLTELPQPRHVETNAYGRIVPTEYIPPLVLDLDGDGVETIAFEDSKAFFDWDGSGFAQKTAWVSKDDGTLVADWNGNGLVDDVSEQFGFQDRRGGFDELRMIDTNKDGVIDSNDDFFSALRIWQDANEDGVTDAGELKTLADRGIRSISLASTEVNTVNNGNTIFEQSAFTKTDGSTGKIYDVALLASATYTQSKGDYTIDADLLNLPWLRGYGHVQDLLVEASQNTELKAFLLNLSQESNALTIYNQVDTLLAKWGGVGNIGLAPNNAMDQAKVAFLEKFLNMSISLDAQAIQYKASVDQAYQTIKDKIFVDFIMQSPIGFGLGVQYDFVTDTHTVFPEFYDNFVASLADTQLGSAAYIIAKTLDSANVLDESLLIDSLQRHGFGDFVTQYLNQQIDFVTPNADGSVTGTSAANLLYTTSIAGVALQGNDGNDVLSSGAGNDTLDGGAGNDVYIADLQSGVDTIIDAAGTDQLILGPGIAKDNLVLSRSGNDLILQVDEQTIATIQAFYPSGAIEKLSFVDGSFLSGSEILAMTANLSGTTGSDSIAGNNFANVLFGDVGADTLTAGAGNDTLDGGAGLDRLIGGTGDDTYIVDNTGDVVVEALFEGVDTVQSSVSYTLSDNVENLTLTGTNAINGTGNAWNNLLTGNSAANVLSGGRGDDTYVIDANDTVVENANEGSDTVQVGVSYALGANVENLTLTGNTAITGTGTSADNILTGNTAASTLIGGAGNDTYMIQNSATVITENVNEGTDTVQSTVSYTLSANVENLTLSGTTALSGTGNALNNTLTGNAAASTLAGASGDDTYIVNDARVVITENVAEGTDTVQASVSYTLAPNVENLVLTGSSAITGTGNSLNNTLTGNAANNILDGGLGADTLAGGLGDDTYLVDDAGDVVTESLASGNDTVMASISYSLGANVENLTLTGSSTLSGVGNSLNNTFTGNNAASTLSAGAGDDRYIISTAGTVIIENANEGTDTVESSVSVSLGANVENLTLTGTSALSGTGNNLNNQLTGNVSASTLTGGLGDDTYVVNHAGTVIVENANEGTDTVQANVSYTLGANVENLTLNAIAATVGVGNTLNNQLLGNAANNTLDGGTGADTLAGGLGDDTYIVDQVDDVIVEKPSEGVDSVQSSVSYTLVDFVENLTLTGTNAINAWGTSYSNVLTGNSAANILKGLDGNDTLDGAAGADTLVGGTGDDMYIVDQAGDVVSENLNEGIDTVQASLNWTLGNHVENLTFTGSDNLVGTGNSLNNTLTGNSGADTLIGGAGDDIYVLQNTSTVITENANEGSDTVQIGSSYTLSANLENLTLTGTAALSGVGNASNNIMTGNAGASTLTGGLGDDTYIISNSNTVIVENSNSGTDTVQASDSYALASNVEHLILTGDHDSNGTGNALNNQLTGNNQANILDGGAGADTLIGGDGNDTYIIDNTGDVITENAGGGNDTVQSSVTYSLSQYLENLTLTGTSAINGAGNAYQNLLMGNTAANQLSGYDGNDTLDGAAGSDTLIGGTGDDLYIVDNVGDVITENANEGVDTVQSSVTYTLSNQVENLTLTGTQSLKGTGNAQDNWLTGNSGNNQLIGLAGNDTLDGGIGIDTLVGGTGNDVYVVDNAADVVTENANEGTDTVYASVSYTLSNNLEHLTLTGLSQIDGTGNASHNQMVGNSQNNVLSALAGNDTLDGGAGSDTLIGGSGDDTYMVDNVGDVITENANEGLDTVQSSVSYTLSANVENLTLNGTQDINATGNSLDNLIIGNSGNNRLDGAGGGDILIGNAGDDTYVVDNTRDTVIENVNEGTDTVQASISYTLTNDVENLVLASGAGALTGSGNALDNELLGNESANRLSGFAGNDTLDGGAGIDTLLGGIGDDSYIVENTADVVIENANEGTDTVYSSVSYTLSSNVENLMLSGSNNIVGTGNTGNNQLSGNVGSSTLIGGAGNDTYILKNTTTVITENANEGSDTVQVAVDYTLGANLENLTLTGYDSIRGTGNVLNNVLTGNVGDNTLDGAAGLDTMLGGWGNDTYIVDNTGDVVTENLNEGVDTVQASVSYTLGANVENLTFTGTANVLGTGNSLNNVLTGNLGLDTLIGGMGDDTYVISNAGTVITENANEGSDTVQVGVSYTLGSNLENLILSGSSNVTGTGNSLNNVLTGNTGSSTLIGGTGNDTYVLQNNTTTITENSNEGTDTVQIGSDYTLGNNLENLTLTGTANSSGTGNALDNVMIGNLGNNTLVGGVGNDTLSGGGGVDTLQGGVGNDTYQIDSTQVTLVENAGEGTDTVVSSVDYVLDANIENLTLTSLTGLRGTGNTLNNVLTGNAGNNTLDGGIGADTLIGGLGDDTYVVDNANDVVTENANEGTDTVQASLNYTLGVNVENLTLLGSGNLTGTGHSGNNVLTGNAGSSTLIGGAGNDTYILQNTGTVITENAGEGTDTVQVAFNYTLGANLENLTITGNTAVMGTGNTLNNQMTGNNAASTLAGGAGNDTYLVQNTDTVITENAGEGTDTVQATAHYTLSSNVENLTLTGAANLNGTGNSLNNLLTGNSGINTLVGLDGNDTLDGGTGADFLYGGVGDDTYLVDHLGDVAIENANEGVDTVQSLVTFTLGANVENLTLVGGSGLSGTGNALNNTLIGNTGDNTLDGGVGADTLQGGLGNDTYVVDNASDVVTENTNEGTDTVQASLNYTLGANVENLALLGIDNLTGTGNSGNNVLTGNAGNSTLVGGLGSDKYILQNSTTTITENLGEGTDEVQVSFNYTLGANVENLVLTGTGNITGTGNSLANVLNGNTGNNTLDGAAGADTLQGGLGDDTYIIDNTGDVITELAGEGVDLAVSSVTYTLMDFVENLTLTGSANINGTGNTYHNIITGNTGNNSLSGGAGNDTLDGGTGNDTLVGGTGDDTFIVDSASDVVTENALEGVDTVQTNMSYTLPNYVENLLLTGIGNISGTGTSFDNYLRGNAGNNTLTGLAGNDTLDGGSGVDTLVGGLGDDTYVVDNASDVVTENTGEGTDTVQASINYVLAANLENLTLTSTAALDGTGNAGNNLLLGNASNNKLDGGVGNDTMAGGQGDDTYVVDSLGDLVIENANEGVDSVQSAVNYVLAQNLENLLLTGTTALYGTGNELDNAVTGNTADNTLIGYAGNDTLDGGVGMDTLTGGLGNDTYVVDNADDLVLEAANEGVDTVQSSVSYSLSGNIENLVLTGSNAIDGVGNNLDNTLTGNTGNNKLTGGDGNDTYRFADRFGKDTIVDSSGNDTLDLSQFSTGLSLDLSQSSFNLADVNRALLDLNSQADGSATLPDLFGNTFTAYGNAAISSSNPWKAGEKSIALDGNGDYFKNTAMTLNGDNWSIHWRMLLNNTTQSSMILRSVATASLQLNFTSGATKLWLSNNNSSYFNNGTVGTKNNWAANQWYDMELSYSSTGGYKLFVDGVLDNQSAATTKIYNPSGLFFGAYNNGTQYFLNGNFADLYYTNSETLHTANFTPSTTSYASQILPDSITWDAGAIENIVGGLGNDSLTGSSGNNSLTGSAGNDTLVGGAGDDTYVFAAGFGTDTITETAGGGNDTLDFSAFTSGITLSLAGSSVTQSTGNVVSWAAGTLENAIMGSGNDSLTGSSGNNVLITNDGNDTLNGGAGDDTLNGGLGNDTYVFASGFGNDTVNDSAGVNTLDFSGFNTGLTVALNQNSFTQSAGNTVSWAAGSLQNIIGGSAADSLTGDNGDNTFTGGAGADTLAGGAGNDTYVFATGFGSDTISNDTSGSNTMDFSAFATALTINLGNTSFTQSAGNVVNWSGSTIRNLVGGSAADNLTGDSADNSLTGKGGNDTLTGGAGNDTYIFAAGFGTDSINDASGTDTFDFSAFSTALSVNLSSTSVTQSTGNVVNWAANAIENLITGSGDDSLAGSASANVLTGNAGNDTLNGGSGNDTLLGGDGNDTYVFASGFGTDTITEMSGTDTLDFIAFTTAIILDLSSGSYNDGLGNWLTWLVNALENITAGSGNNALTGTDFNNVLTSGAGNDTLTGGAGNDTLVGGTGNDSYVFSGNYGLDSINDAGGVDTIDLSALSGNSRIDLSQVSYTDAAGNGVLWMSGSIENLTTGSGDDSVNGNTGDNVLTTGAGNDTLNGGAGNDTLNGGSGDDTYVYAPGSGIDSIIDASGNDTLDLSVDTAGVNVSLNTTSFSSSFNPAASVNNALLNLNSQADGSATLPDLFGNTFTAYGNAAISSSNPWKAGEKSIALDGNGDYFKNTAMTLNGDNWSIHWRMRLNSTPQSWMILRSVATASLQLNFVSGATKLWLSSNNSSYFNNGTVGTKNNWAANQWYDMELSYSSTGGYKLFVDGVLDNQSAATTKIYNPSGLFFGAYNNGTQYFLNGNFADLYYTNSETLHTANFTPSSNSYMDQFTSRIEWAAGSVENVIGGSGNDTLTGNAGNNILTGGAGNDSLAGDAGNDTYRFAAGFGLDTVTDAGGSDTLDFSVLTTNLAVDLNATAFTESAGNSVSWAANSVENITGGAGNDSLTGNSLANVLTGGNGMNTLTGGAGNDTLVGGLDGDTYVFANGFGADSITDVSGVDTLNFSAVSTNLTYDATSGTASTNGNTLTWSASATSFEKVIGGSGNDSLTGNAGDETLVGGAGNDTLNGGLGNDTYAFAEGFGVDSLADVGGFDTLDFNQLVSGLNYDGANTQVTVGIHSITWSSGSASIEQIQGGAGNDVFLGHAQAETLQGNAGNDTLTGNAGNDLLMGGVGNDVYRFNVGDGLDIVLDNDTAPGNLDTVRFGNTVTAANIAVFMVNNDLQIGYTNSSGDLITIQGQNLEGQTIERFELDNGFYMTDAEMNQVIQNMTAYANANGITISNLNDVKNNQALMSLVNAGWHA